MVARADAVADFRPIPGNFYDVREKVLAGYLMSTTRYGWGSVVGGARVEQVENRSRALASVGGALRPIEIDNDDTSIYPSVHVNYDFARDQRLRLSLTTGASRPDFDQLRPNFTFDDSARTVSGGNPNALPEKATGLDAYWEWYVQPQGYVMFGAFYKDVLDVLFTDTKTFGSDVLNTPAVDRSQYTFSTLLNGGSGHIYGLEAAVQQQVEPFLGRLGLPGWMGGFGISANLTLNDSEAEKPDGTKVSLPGTSDVVYNVGVYYEKYRVSARLNYQRRSEWLDAIGSPVDGGDQYWAADDEMDFSLRYAINRQFEVYFDAVNLLDNAGRRYSRDPASTIEWERFGRRYIGGFRVSL
jgi:TonB-dependent receptor